MTKSEKWRKFLTFSENDKLKSVGEYVEYEGVSQSDDPEVKEAVKWLNNFLSELLRQEVHFKNFTFDDPTRVRVVLDYNYGEEHFLPFWGVDYLTLDYIKARFWGVNEKAKVKGVK